MWFPRVFYKRCFRLGPSRDALAPLLLASYSVASVVWSDYPEITARASLEFFSMIVCVIVIARIVSTEAFIKGLILGCCCVLIATLIDGKADGRDYFTGEYTLVGMFGSKNQVGLYAGDRPLCGDPGIFPQDQYHRENRLRRCSNCRLRRMPCYQPFGNVRRLVGHSFCGDRRGMVGSKISPAPALARVHDDRAYRNRYWRCRIYLNEQGVLFAMLGKNGDFQGRTYLWAEGWKVALKAPVFGHGYNAFWVQGSLRPRDTGMSFKCSGAEGFIFTACLLSYSLSWASSDYC